MTGGTAARALAWLLLVSLAPLVVACSARSDPGPQRVVMHDGFDGTSLTPSRWATCHWWGPTGCTILSNPEQEWYAPDQVSVRSGALRLEARPQPSVHFGKRLGFVSGMVSSGRSGEGRANPPRFAFTYGTVQVRFRTPRGGGLWPAIWMLPASNSSLPEIDLLEQYGDDTRDATLTLHTAGSGGERVEQEEVRGADLAVGWHTVRLEWSKGHLRWLLDGLERFRVDGSQVPSEPMYLVMNLAVTSSNGPPDPAAFPSAFLIDDVTVWGAPGAGGTSR